MIGNKRLLAIIPARIGSKRIHKKNILNLAGKPLIGWTIEAALSSQYIDKIIVSTDSNEIANISQNYKVDVPFLRPHSLSSDTASSIDVIIHTLEYLKKIGDYYDYIVLLQPTSPLRTSSHIDEAVCLLIENKGYSVISVSEPKDTPFWCNELPKDNNMSNFLNPLYSNKRSQELPITFCLNGAIYIALVDQLLENKSFFMSDKTFAYKMDKKDSIDIDDELDFEFADFLIRKKNSLS